MVECEAFPHYKKHQAQTLLCERVLLLAVALNGTFFFMMSQNDNYINGNKGSGDCVSSIVWPSKCPRVSQPGLGRNPASVKRIKNMLIGCWNVRTLSDLPASSKLLERCTALISRELQHYGLEIVALSETRLTDEGNVSDGGYTFFWKGKPHGSKKESGVAFAVKTCLLS